MKKSIKYQYFLPDFESRLIRNYVSHGYRNLNQMLRKSKNKNTDLNRVIFDFYPLDKDIVVFRIIRSNEFIEDDFYNGGYLSTTIMISEIIEDIIKDELRPNFKKSYIMEIIVPKGTHCLWIPSHENEILLPHLTRLKLNYEDNRVYSKKFIKIYNYVVI